MIVALNVDCTWTDSSLGDFSFLRAASDFLLRGRKVLIYSVSVLFLFLNGFTKD